MKKVLIATNIVTLGIAIFLFFKEQGSCPTQPGTETKCCTYDDLTGETFGDFKDVVKRYKDNSWTAINNNMNQVLISRGIPNASFNDARCIWFSMDSIKQFICTIEKYSGQLNLTTENLGIRLYYGQYPDTHPHYADQHTIFMIPTYSTSQAGEAIDFNPRENVQNGWGTRSSKEIRSLGQGYASSPGASHPILALSASQNIDPTIRNSGELCPPKCPPGNSTFDVTDQP